MITATASSAMIPFMPRRDPPVLLDYDLHPPQDLRVFPVPAEGVLRADDDVLVTETRWDDVVLRHYAFRHHWMKVNVTVDESGVPLDPPERDGNASYAFNCDIATPMRWDANCVYSVDLWLDVLVRADGCERVITDEDDFEKAIDAQWLSEREASAARHSLEILLAMIDTGQLLEVLDGAQPFAPPVDPPPAHVRHVPLSSVPLLQPGRRPTW